MLTSSRLINNTKEDLEKAINSLKDSSVLISLIFDLSTHHISPYDYESEQL